MSYSCSVKTSTGSIYVQRFHVQRLVDLSLATHHDVYYCIFVDLRAPTNVVATVRSCDTITLQWTQPSKPNDIITSVSCTPPSPGCAECTTSPCTITGLNTSTEYEFTVTLNSGGCRASMNTATARTMGEIDYVKCAYACLVSAFSVLVQGCVVCVYTYIDLELQYSDYFCMFPIVDYKYVMLR